jgi:general secretion pathway protein J
MSSRGTLAPFFNRGFTLIELLVALVILTFIAVAGYSGLNTVVQTRDRIAQETRKWQHLTFFFSRLEQDVAQAVYRPVRGTDGFTQAEWIGRVVTMENEAQLTFTRASMADAALQAPQRIGYHLEKNTIQLFRWPFPDQAPNTQPIIYPLLEGVSDFNLHYLSADRIWHRQWPVANGRNEKLPMAVEVQLTLVSGEKIRRIFALQ